MKLAWFSLVGAILFPNQISLMRKGLFHFGFSTTLGFPMEEEACGFLGLEGGGGAGVRAVGTTMVLSTQPVDWIKKAVRDKTQTVFEELLFPIVSPWQPLPHFGTLVWTMWLLDPSRSFNQSFRKLLNYLNNVGLEKFLAQ